MALLVEPEYLRSTVALDIDRRAPFRLIVNAHAKRRTNDVNQVQDDLFNLGIRQDIRLVHKQECRLSHKPARVLVLPQGRRLSHQSQN